MTPIASYKGTPLQLIYLDEQLLAQHVANTPNLPLTPSSKSANGPVVPIAAKSCPKRPATIDAIATTNAKDGQPTNVNGKRVSVGKTAV